LQLLPEIRHVYKKLWHWHVGGLVIKGRIQLATG
jgi:hypothetical protein